MRRIGMWAIAVASCGIALYACNEDDESPTAVGPTPTPVPVANMVVENLPRPIGTPAVPVPGVGTGPGGVKATPPPTPTPEPSVEPTPEPTPTPTPNPACAAAGTLTFTGAGTPLTRPWNRETEVSLITLTGLPSGCRVKTAKYTLSFTSDVNLSTVADSLWMVVVQGAGGGIQRAYLIDSFWTKNVPATFSGFSAGTSCGSLNFTAGAPSFTTANPPYDGTFSPGLYGGNPDSLVGLLTDDLEGDAFHLSINARDPSNVTLKCWKMALTFEP